MKKINDFYLDDKEYFTNNKNRITERNSRMLLQTCILYIFVLLFYTILTIVTNHNTILEILYYFFDAIHIIFTILIVAYYKKIKKSFYATQILSIIFEISVLSFFALEGVFASKTDHSLYIPIAILLVLLIFVHNIHYTLIVITSYIVFFIVLSCLFKEETASINDIYIGIATFIASLTSYTLISRTRQREGEALVKFEKLSKIDSLTDIYNKTTIELICKDFINDSQDKCSLLVIDIDDFKQINDKYGHETGDDVLTFVASMIKESFTSTDCIGRFGGDEFVILLKNQVEKEDIIKEIEVFNNKISDFTIMNNSIIIHCCIGIVIKEDNEDYDKMFSQADDALYYAKNSGKNKYHFYK